MQRYIAAGTIVCLLAMVLIRVGMMRRAGIRAMNFGALDKRDFIIPPFALLYFYLIFAKVFALPTMAHRSFFDFEITSWIGVAFCLAGLVLLLMSLISFGTSFRVGIDENRPDKLVTSGAFALSRNPIYVAFFGVLVGQFLIFSNWILLLYLVAAAAVFHRQVLREEGFLKEKYGEEYAEYARRVRRYV